MSCTPATFAMPSGQLPGIGKAVSRLVLGTMIINTEEEEASFQLLDDAFTLGWNTLDTAHVYAGGNSERCIGQWMKKRGNRDAIVILAKGAHHNPDRPRVTPFDIAADLHDTLARLGTTYVDMYLLHRDNPSIPVGPIMEAMNEHIRAGRIRAIGGSNWTHDRLAEANEYARQKGLIPFTVSSPHFSLAEQVDNPWGAGCVGISGPSQATARSWYAVSGVRIFAYSSLARGFFSGRVLSSDGRDGAKQKVDQACWNAYCHPGNFERLRRAEILAKAKCLTVPQIATAYIMNHPLRIFACIGAASRLEMQANLAAASIQLSPAEMAWLDLERPDYP